MLYICLPVYNTDVTRLANELLEQSKDSAVELLIVDDCSTNHFKDINSEFCQDKDQITYISLPNNIGRSAIRNYFLGLKSKGHFLFLDGDSIICRSNFISTYIDHNRIFEAELKGKLQDFYNALNWGEVMSEQKNAEKFFSF